MKTNSIPFHDITIWRISKLGWPSLEMYTVPSNCTLRAKNLDHTSRLMRRLTGSTWKPTAQFAWPLPTRNFSSGTQRSSKIMHQSHFLMLIDAFKAKLVHRSQTETTPNPRIYDDEIANLRMNHEDHHVSATGDIEGHRTNNHLEGWHHKLNKPAQKSHPNIFEVVQLLQRGRSWLTSWRWSSWMVTGVRIVPRRCTGISTPGYDHWWTTRSRTWSVPTTWRIWLQNADQFITLMMPLLILILYRHVAEILTCMLTHLTYKPPEQI